MKIRYEDFTELREFKRFEYGDVFIKYINNEPHYFMKVGVGSVNAIDLENGCGHLFSEKMVFEKVNCELLIKGV